MKSYYILAIAMIVLLCGKTSANAQIIYPQGNIRKCLNEYLHQIQATENKCYDRANLHIWNLLSNKDVHSDSDLNAIGIYGFLSVGSHQNTYIFLKFHDSYEILPITEGKHNESRNYSAIIDDLQAYFTKHPSIDPRLLPLYHKAVCDVYIDNTQIDQLGSWFDWYAKDVLEYFE